MHSSLAEDKTRFIVLARGKRLHQLCTLACLLPTLDLVGLWSPDSIEARSASDRYRVPIVEDIPSLAHALPPPLVLAAVLPSTLAKFVALGGKSCIVPPAPVIGSDGSISELQNAADQYPRSFVGMPIILEPSYGSACMRTGESLLIERLAMSEGELEYLDSLHLAERLICARAATALALASCYLSSYTRPTSISASLLREVNQWHLSVSAPGMTAIVSCGAVEPSPLSLLLSSGQSLVAKDFSADMPSVLVRGIEAAQNASDDDLSFGRAILDLSSLIHEGVCRSRNGSAMRLALLEERL